MKQYLSLSAIALASVLAFGPAAHARDRTADRWNSPMVLRSSESYAPMNVARRGNEIFLYNQGGSLERTTLVTEGPAVIAEAPKGKRAKIVTHRTMPEVIAEGPRHQLRTKRVTTRATFLTSNASPNLAVETPVQTTFIRTGSQPEVIAEGPTFSTKSDPEVIAGSSTYEVRKSGELFSPDGLSLSGRGPHLTED